VGDGVCVGLTTPDIRRRHGISLLGLAHGGPSATFASHRSPAWPAREGRIHASPRTDGRCSHGACVAAMLHLEGPLTDRGQEKARLRRMSLEVAALAHPTTFFATSPGTHHRFLLR
jgi:hypothetical protein